MDRTQQEEQLVTSLLTPFKGLEPVTLASRQHARRRKLLIYAALAFAIIVTGAAIAGAPNPLGGIGAADHSQTPSDVLDAGVQAQLRADLVPPGGIDQVGVRRTDSARFVGTLPSGRKVYVVPTEQGRLCVVLARSAESCSGSLTPAEPVTFTAVWDHPGDPAYAYGVARDGVRSILFSFRGNHVTVPVEHNFYAYQTEPLDQPPGFGGLTVTLDDGTTQAVG
jgi:hypothetical protein